MANTWKIVGFMSLGAWLVVMIAPVFGGWNGFSAVTAGPRQFSVSAGVTGSPYFYEALVASLVLAVLTVVAFVLATRSSN